MTIPPAHPPWCDPQRCDISDPTLGEYHGAHRSKYEVLEGLAPLAIGRDRLQVAVAYLWQPAGPYRSTSLVLESTVGSISMPLLKAVAPLIQIARLIGRGEVTA
jgi:hypothetical protein